MVNVVYRLICAHVFQIFLGILANRCVIHRMCHLYHCGVLQNFLGEKNLLKTTSIIPLTVNSVTMTFSLGSLVLLKA